ncbi:MAG TPA: carboxypeptidase-like regulatory domain-containing protein [Thermoanaerobaculia bacterium]|nr:carboxypeptidase-like regulatory domain-containing protein [Thermoanaerobaculia bacterium]
MHVRFSVLLSLIVCPFAMAASITGVVTAPSGAPIANARVAVFREMPPPALIALDAPPRPLASVTTGASGAFSVEPGSNGVVVVHVSADGFEPVDIATDPEPLGTLMLRPAETVTGRVTANGKPVANAAVIAMPVVQGIPTVVMTDADGKYRIAEPTWWAESILVRHPDFAPAVHPISSRDFVLSSGDTLRGSVVDENGRPAGGAAVSLDGLLETTTGADGRFTIAHVYVRPLRLVARSGSRIATALASEKAIVLKLAPARRIAGTLVDETNKPVAGAIVTALGDALGDSTLSDARGAFAISVPAGQYLVSASAHNLEADSGAADVTGADANVALHATHLLPLQGVVQTADGKPVGGAALFVLAGEGDDAMPMPLSPRASGADGRFRVRTKIIDSQPERIVAMKPGMPLATSPLVTPRTREVVVTMPDRGVEVHGVVTGRDGKPLADVAVTPLPGERRFGEPALLWATTDAAGRFSGYLAAGSTALGFAKRGYVREEQRVTVTADAKPVAVSLRATVGIRGRVVNADGSPAAEVPVLTRSEQAQTDANGTFVLENLEPGPQQILFGKEGEQRATVKAPASDVRLVLKPSDTR